MRKIGWIILGLATISGCGSDDDDPAPPRNFSQIDVGLPGVWARVAPCPLEVAAFCGVYRETLEADTELLRGTLYLGAQNRELGVATYRIAAADLIEVRDVATDEKRAVRVTVGATNLRLCDANAPTSCAEFTRVESVPPKPAGNHALPPIARVVYELAIDGANTVVEETGSAATAIFPPSYGEVAPKTHSRGLVEPTPGNLHYANVHGVLVGADPERVSDYRFYVEIFRTGRDANVPLGNSGGLVSLVEGMPLEITGSDGDHAYRFRMTVH